MPLVPLELQLFGPLSVKVHGVPISRWRTRSVAWLLALLALRQGRPVERSWLAGTLWPESTESSALRNLRDDLMRLRRALGQEAGRIQSPSRDRLLFVADGASIDVRDFDRSMLLGDEASLACAVAVYHGPLLEGCLEEWVAPEREQRAAACLAALERLAEAAEGRQEWSTALELLRKAEGLDPLRDSIQRGLLRVLAATGDLPEATRVYREFRLRLHRELSAEPDPETTRLFEMIRDRARHSTPERVRASDAPPKPVPAAQPAREPEPAPFALPAAAALPHPLTGLIGRDEELRAVPEMLQASRLVTIVGGGGLGKTRLAVEAGRRLQPEFAQGVAFAPLAGVSDASLLATFVAEVLGVEPPIVAGTPLAEAELLLVLDNCEHLVDEAATLAQALLERCPRLRILATSRQRLGIMGEVVWRIPSLTAPGEEARDKRSPGAAELALYPAARLLLERLAMVKPGFRIERPEQARAVAQICRRLDGIPLALELAAARAAHLPVEEIAARLDDRFRLLVGGNRGVLPRHRTLRTLVDWSYDLLNERERTLFRRLAVFSGGWSLEAAEAVCGNWSGPDESAAVHREDLLELLIGLVEQSLVQTEEREGAVRYVWLETLREYALERLHSSGEETLARRRHRDYFLRVAETSATAMSAGETRCLEVLGREHGNLRAALAFCHEDPEGAVPGLRMADALWQYWILRGHYAEGSEHLRAALARELSSTDPQDLNIRSSTLVSAGILALDRGDRGEAERLISEGKRGHEQIGNARGIARACSGLGHLALQRDRPHEARAFYLQALEISRSVGNPWAETANLGNLGAAALVEEEYELAASHYREARNLARKMGNPVLEGSMTTYLGLSCLEARRMDEASSCLRVALRTFRPFGATRLMAETLELGAAVSMAQGDLLRGLHLYGAAESLRRENQLSARPLHPNRKQIDLETATAALGTAACEAALTEGGAMPLERLLGSGAGSEVGSPRFHGMTG